MKKKRKKKICGSSDTVTKRPCRITIFPCTLHFPDGKRRPRELNLRRRRLAERIPKSKSIAQAGRLSGYSDESVKARIYDIVKSPDIQEAILQSRERALLNSSEMAGESDKSVDRNVVNEVRIEFYQDVEDLMCRYEDADIPISREDAIGILKPIFAQLLSKPVFEAALNDLEVNNNSKLDLDAAIEDFVSMAKDLGISVTRENAAARLKPFFRHRPAN